MQGVFLIITLAVLGANLLVDLLYGVIDPRTRARLPEEGVNHDSHHH